MGKLDHYILLDGHVRLAILKDLNHKTTECLVSTEDEGLTYNHKVNQLSAIQEHFMILKAIKLGVSEERIANTLDVDVSSIRRKRNLLDGICPEAVHLLKQKQAGAKVFREMRRVKPIRQIEMAELMTVANNFTEGYARCLYAATPREQQVDPEKSKEIRGLTQEDIARMELEMESLSKDFRLINDSHGRNVLNLVLVVGYLKKLLDNARVVRYLSQHYADILAEFQKIIETKGLDSQYHSPQIE